MGHKEIVELLIENEADINARTETGHTPFHIGNFILNLF